MQDQMSLDLVAQPARRQRARAARDKGIQRAIDHANAVEPTWGEVAYRHLTQLVMDKPSGATLTSEAIREFARQQGLCNPPDGRAWGAVLLRSARAGVLKKVGWTISEDPTTHCSPVALWAKP